MALMEENMPHPPSWSDAGDADAEDEGDADDDDDEDEDGFALDGMKVGGTWKSQVSGSHH